MYNNPIICCPSEGSWPGLHLNTASAALQLGHMQKSTAIMQSCLKEIVIRDTCVVIPSTCNLFEPKAVEGEEAAVEETEADSCLKELAAGVVQHQKS